MVQPAVRIRTDSTDCRHGGAPVIHDPSCLGEMPRSRGTVKNAAALAVCPVSETPYIPVVSTIRNRASLRIILS
jgi:hypothetical protein